MATRKNKYQQAAEILNKYTKVADYLYGTRIFTRYCKRFAETKAFEQYRKGEFDMLKYSPEEIHHIEGFWHLYNEWLNTINNNIRYVTKKTIKVRM